MKKSKTIEPENVEKKDEFKRCIDCFWCRTRLIDSDEKEYGPNRYICCYSPTDGIPWIPCYSAQCIEEEIQDSLSKLKGVRRELINIDKKKLAHVSGYSDGNYGCSTEAYWAIHMRRDVFACGYHAAWFRPKED